jgi:diacylglycerol kinase
MATDEDFRNPGDIVFALPLSPKGAHLAWRKRANMRIAVAGFLTALVIAATPAQPPPGTISGP